MPKTSQTKLLLAQSLQQLMLTMPLEKISVNDIVEKAGVGRNTFYYHFADKYDLVTWYFQTGVTPFLFEHTKYGSWQDILLGLEEYFRQNKVFYQNALAYTGQNSLSEYIYDFMQKYNRQRLSECRPDMRADELEFLSQFLAGAGMGVLMPWVRGGMERELSQQTGYLLALHDSNLLHELLDGTASAAPPKD
ncbi:TetR/AcrR family transcriptional regulator C-terminal domain-containing protein [uncultured Gemmiger sp.]|uniref:TetR/AcrR family transcriptional regulator C-terminal domain-containing protein n=1 Tax=uncultured Gemmiger sp. TaxID=1623490 RepID=UPI0025FAF5E3|nr:TetR/AcrR family transcriptional regulator C-terminal domain-containing protein [uncultured Gemmiger sp.]